MHLRHIASTASYGTLKRTFDSRPPSGTRRPSRSGDDEEPLRRHERADALAEPLVQPFRTGTNMRVLVVQYDPHLCELLREFLVGLRHQPRIVHTAEAALDLVRAERPDVVLLDIRLPGMSGLDFLRLQAVRELRAPIVVISGNVTESQAHESLELGAFDFIGKPLPLTRLEELLACLGPDAAPRRPSREQEPRRRAPRAPVALPVRVREPNGTDWEAVSVNVSGSGIKVRATSPVQPGPAARLSIALPDAETRLEGVSGPARPDLCADA